MSNANGSDTLIVLERGAFSLREKYNVDDSRDVQAFVGRLVVLWLGNFEAAEIAVWAESFYNSGLIAHLECITNHFKKLVHSRNPENTCHHIQSSSR